MVRMLYNKHVLIFIINNSAVEYVKMQKTLELTDDITIMISDGNVYIFPKEKKILEVHTQNTDNQL